MHTIHRVYIGARNTPHHKILPADENKIARILKKYLRGWTTTKAVGYWGGTSEETLILTVVQSPQVQTGWGNGIESAVGEIGSFLHQYAILWESNGTAVVIPTNKKKASVLPANAGPASSPLADVKIKSRPKSQKTKDTSAVLTK